MITDNTTTDNKVGAIMRHPSNAFRILSIDGGGLRGLFAVYILKELQERLTKRPLIESFDLFAGTSTGGLISVALTLGDNNGIPKYPIEEIEKIYLRHGKDIFPARSRLKKIIRPGWLKPRYNETGINAVLEQYLANNRIEDCIKPIFVTSFDLERYEPIYFTSRFAAFGQSTSSNVNAYLKDICRASSSAPIYFPSHSFVYADGADKNYETNCIDGGVYSNNPALAAYVEVITHLENSIYSNQKGKQAIEVEDIHILSIGTGKVLKTMDRKTTKNWGMLRWGLPVIDVMMDGNSHVVDTQLDKLLKFRYLRIDENIKIDYSKLTDHSAKTQEYFKDKAKEIFDNGHFLEKLQQFQRVSNI